jgi:hypothetical protein
MLRKALLACGVVSSVVYVAADVAASLRYPGYSYRSQVISELLAAGSPVRPFMVATAGVPYNLLVGAFAVGVCTSAWNRRGRATGGLLLGYAASSAAGAFLFFMDRREVLAAGEGTSRNAMHAPITGLLSLFLLAAMAFGATLLGRRFRRYTYATIVLLIVFGVLTSLYIPRFDTGEPTPWVGITERVNIYATMLWIVVLAIGLLRAPARQSLPIGPR